MNQAVAAINPGRAMWLKERRRGLGGTDASAILGANPWMTAFDVWLEKTGQVKEKPATKAMEWGLLLEDVIADRYAARTGRKLWKPDRLMVHPDHECIVGTPDRLVIGEDRGVEVKTSGSYMAHEWGAEFTDEMPRQYIVQAAHYMAITGFPVWDVIVLIGGNEDRIYTVRRDQDFEKTLIERLTSWWERYIVKGEEHPVDGGDGAATYLNGKHPVAKGERIGADVEADRTGQKCAQIKKAISDLEESEAECVNRLKAFVGDAVGMDGNGWRCTWTGGGEKATVNHEKYAALLADALTMYGMGDVVNQALAASREVKVSPRAFRFNVNAAK